MTIAGSAFGKARLLAVPVAIAAIVLGAGQEAQADPLPIDSPQSILPCIQRGGALYDQCKAALDLADSVADQACGGADTTTCIDNILGDVPVVPTPVACNLIATTSQGTSRQLTATGTIGCEVNPASGPLGHIGGTMEVCALDEITRITVCSSTGLSFGPGSTFAGPLISLDAVVPYCAGGHPYQVTTIADVMDEYQHEGQYIDVVAAVCIPFAPEATAPF